MFFIIFLRDYKFSYGVSGFALGFLYLYPYPSASEKNIITVLIRLKSLKRDQYSILYTNLFWFFNTLC